MLTFLFCLVLAGLIALVSELLDWGFFTTILVALIVYVVLALVGVL